MTRQLWTLRKYARLLLIRATNNDRAWLFVMTAYIHTNEYWRWLILHNKSLGSSRSIRWRIGSTSAQNKPWCISWGRWSSRHTAITQLEVLTIRCGRTFWRTTQWRFTHPIYHWCVRKGHTKYWHACKRRNFLTCGLLPRRKCHRAMSQHNLWYTAVRRRPLTYLRYVPVRRLYTRKIL